MTLCRRRHTYSAWTWRARHARRREELRSGATTQPWDTEWNASIRVSANITTFSRV